MDRPWSVIDLFAGAGGLSAGLRRASGRFLTKAAIELDPDAAATFGANFPEAEVFRESLEDWVTRATVPSADLVIGGPPCQGFSALGNRDALDARNSLWEAYVAAVARIRPHFFVMENVPQFRDSEQFELFASSFEKAGPLSDYGFEARILNAVDYGVPQNRKRVVVMGFRNALGSPGFPKTGDRERRTLRDAVGSVAPSVAGTELPRATGDEASRGPYSTSELHLGRNYSELSLKRFAAIPPAGNRFDLPDELKAPCWIAHTAGSADVMGRLSWEKPSVTIRTEFFKPEKGRYLHPTEDRAITHMEAALIQGFNTTYKWYGSKTSIARQIGNAVPIELGAALGRTLLDALDAKVAPGALVANQ